MENGKCPHCGYEAGDADVCPCCGKKIKVASSNKGRTSLSDAGLMLAASLFVIIIIKSLLFGFTWLGTIWLVVDIIYLILQIRSRRIGGTLRTATIWFMSFSLLALVLMFVFDEEAKPKMPVFQGAATDTVVTAPVVEEVEPEPVVVDTMPDSTELSVDTVAATEPSAPAESGTANDSLSASASDVEVVDEL